MGGYPNSMLGLFHGKSHLEIDDWGVPLWLRNPPSTSHSARRRFTKPTPPTQTSTSCPAARRRGRGRGCSPAWAALGWATTHRGKTPGFFPRNIKKHVFFLLEGSSYTFKRNNMYQLVPSTKNTCSYVRKLYIGGKKLFQRMTPLEELLMTYL